LRGRRDADDLSAGEETIVHAQRRFAADGYTDDFRATSDGLMAVACRRTYAPEELAVEEVFRFEGMSDPDDEAILFALRAPDGVKGTYTVAYGAAMDGRDAAMVQRLPRPGASAAPSPAFAF
jgi:hypothetical protein